AWLAEHHEELFKKTALLINAEHTAAAQPELLGEAIRLVNNEAGFLWYGGGNQRPKLQQAAINAFMQFGVPIYSEPENAAPRWRGQPVVSVRAGRTGVQLQHVLPFGRRNARHRTGTRTRGNHAGLRKDHRRSEQARIEGSAAVRGSGVDAPAAIARSESEKT